MRTAPRLHGGLAARVGALFLGLVVIAVAVVFLLESRLGLAPWEVLHLGLARHSPLSIGTASIVVGLSVLCVSWAFGQPPGFGTVANAVVIGACVDLLLRLEHVTDLSKGGLPFRALLLVVAVGAFGLGSALYIGAGLGAGPRDSLMLVGSRRTGIRIAGVRLTMELVVVIIGFSLGGVVGVGTLLFVLLIGPVVEASFWLLIRLGVAERTPLVERAPASQG